MAREDGIVVTYDGTTYRIADPPGQELIASGLLVPDEDLPGWYRLDIHHVIDEIQPYATPIDKVPSDDDRGPGAVEAGRRRLLAVAFQHRDGQGAR